MIFNEREELESLLSALVDERIDAQKMRQLEGVISRSEDARRHYLEYMQLSASLCGFADETLSGGGEPEECGPGRAGAVAVPDGRSRAHRWSRLVALGLVAAGVAAGAGAVYVERGESVRVSGSPAEKADTPDTSLAGFSEPPAPRAYVERFGDEVLVEGIRVVGKVEIGGGIIILRKVGDQEMDQPSGIVFDISQFNGQVGPTTSWIMETVIGDVDSAGPQETLMSFNGRFGIRRSGQATQSWRMFSYGSSGPRNTPIPGPQDGDHVALVFEEMGAEDTISYYLNGELCKAVSDRFNHSANHHEAAFGCDVVPDSQGYPQRSRGIRGSLDAIAFRAFEGPFEPSATTGFSLLE
ncbi:hypothetical protein BH23VER1_BH23VER1_28670 [soil metagenome]